MHLISTFLYHGKINYNNLKKQNIKITKVKIEANQTKNSYCYVITIENMWKGNSFFCVFRGPWPTINLENSVDKQTSLGSGKLHQESLNWKIF
jgi:hypothetical protein